MSKRKNVSPAIWKFREPAAVNRVRKPEVNMIAMGFLFHRLVVLGRGVTDLDKETVAAQTAPAEATA